MKKIIFIFSSFVFIFSCNKENKVISNYQEVLKGTDLKNMSDEEKLKFFSSIEFKDFDLNNFNIKRINDIEMGANKLLKADFTKDKIDFSVRISFPDKTKYYTIYDQKLILSDSKKTGYYSANDNSYFISGYFKGGKFFFDKVNKLGF